MIQNLNTQFQQKSSQQAFIWRSANLRPSCASSKTSPTPEEVTPPWWPITGVLGGDDSGVVMATVARGNNLWRAIGEPAMTEIKALMVAASGWVGRVWPLHPTDLRQQTQAPWRVCSAAAHPGRTAQRENTASPAQFTGGTDAEQQPGFRCQWFITRERKQKSVISSSDRTAIRHMRVNHTSEVSLSHSEWVCNNFWY